MTRTHHRSAVLLILLVGCGGSATAPTSPISPADASRGAPREGEASTATRSAVERLLDRSGIESILSGRPGLFTRQVALMAGDLTDPELERLVPAVQAAFAPEPMRRDVAAFLTREAPGDGTVEEVLAWQERGAQAELQRISDAYEPPLTLSEYARSLVSTPPEPARLDLMVDWTGSQRAGEFYVLMEEALDQAAHSALAELRPNAPGFTPLEGAALQQRLADSFHASVVTFLHRYETVPDTIIRAATAEYRTEAGQWYVRTYSLAVAEAIRAAGQRVVAALRS